MVFLNETNIIFTSMEAVTSNITGSWFLTLLFITLLFMGFAFAFKIPIEFTTILVFPLLIGFAAYSGAYISVLAVAMIYLSVLVAKNFFFWQ